MLGIKHALTTSYHPQSDDQTERINQEIERFLQIFCNHLQDNWDQLLALAEFSYNNSVHSTMQSTLFMLHKGRNPHMARDYHPFPTKLNDAEAKLVRGVLRDCAPCNIMCMAPHNVPGHSRYTHGM